MFTLILTMFALNGYEKTFAIKDNLNAEECAQLAFELEELLILRIDEGFELTCESPMPID